jgi:hypothetical protein
MTQNDGFEKEIAEEDVCFLTCGTIPEKNVSAYYFYSWSAVN